jgi:hypothetical protein
VSAASSRATGSRRSTRVQMRDEEEDIQAALEQSAREAEMDRAMRGPSDSASNDDESGDEDDDDDEDDEQIVGALKPKMAIVIESDDEEDDDDGGGPAPMALDSSVKSNGASTAQPPAAATASTPSLATNGFAPAEAGAMDVDGAAP